MCSVKIRLGYACINLSLKKKFRTFRLKTLEERDIPKIKEIIHHNISLLGDIIQYNVKHNILVYRISSDIIPFGSHPLMTSLLKEEGILEEEKVQREFEYIRKQQEAYGMRLSMHPSQFTLLTSPKEDVTERAILDIQYQTHFIKNLGGSNVIIHVGGAYGNKEKAILRFRDRISKYKEDIDMNILTIENDDKTYTSQEVVEICTDLGLKWVYDFHHERCNPSNEKAIDLLRRYPPDKYHLSSGINGVYKPPHAGFIEPDDYVFFIKQLAAAGIEQADVMLEAKQKNLAIFEICKPLANGYWELKE